MIKRSINFKIVLIVGFLVFFSFAVSSQSKITINHSDFSVVYEDSIQLIGLISDDSVQWVRYNDDPLTIKNQRFSFEVPLKIGINLIELEAQDSSGSLMTISRKVLRKMNFPDLAHYFWAKKEIEDLGTLGIVSPYYDGTFKPEKSVERAELAATLVKIIEADLPTVESDVFSDVKVDYWGSPYIKVAVEKGYFTDYPDGTFKPLRFVTRAEAVVILLRFAGIKEPKEITKAPYTDVPIDHWAAKAITRGLEVGVLKDSLMFKPHDQLTRASLAFIIAKLPIIEQIVNQLYDFSELETKKKKSIQLISTQKPKIESVSITPNFIPANSNTEGIIEVKITHPKGLDKLKRVRMACETIGWGEDSHIFLYDDGNCYADKKAHDGVFTGKIIVMEDVKPGNIQVPIRVEDIYGNTTHSSIVLNVVSTINGMF